MYTLNKINVFFRTSLVSNCLDICMVSPKNARLFGKFVKVVEVGPRDGLQNELTVIPAQTKMDFINRLSETGLKHIEVTSFVSPKWVPQMADNAEVFAGIKKDPNISYTVLVPNLIGLENAVKVGVRDIAVFGAASESFTKKNINCTVQQSMNQLTEVADQAKKSNIKIRGYISCCMGCPYEGEIKPTAVTNVAALMLNLGCYEISLGDTIGVGTPSKIRRVLREMKNLSGDLSEFALHCHDTYGQAVANIYTGLEYGIRIFDSSVAGLGGCPYAAGATGNVATEDLLYLLKGQGMETNIDINKIVDIGDFISNVLGKKNQSKAGVAMLARKKLKKP